LIEQFKQTFGVEEIDTTEVAQWAYGQHIWQPTPVNPVQILARQLSRALRQEYYIDAQGREVRRIIMCTLSKKMVPNSTFG